MASPAELVRMCLVHRGWVTMPDPTMPIPANGSTYCFVSSLPNEPDQLLYLRDSTGLIFGKRQNDGKVLEHPGIVIIMRSLDFGRDWAMDLLEAIESITHTDITMPDGMIYHVQSVYRTSTLADMGEEVGKRRHSWTANARVAMQDLEVTQP